MSRRNRRWIAVLVATIAILAGCTGASSGGGGDGGPDGSSVDFEGEPAVSTVMATGTPVAEPADGGDGGRAGVVEYSAEQFAARQLILTGQVAIEVDDFEAARSNLTGATEGYGGFVSDTRQEVHRIDNETWTEGMVVLRVPRDNFTALYERAKAEGELVNAAQNSQDVTDQLVDIQARLENLRAERDQLRALYGRANTTEDILRVQERLSDVQGEIERLEARQQSLRQRVALSTITVRIAEPRPKPDEPIPDRWYDIPLLAAFLASVDGVVVTLRALAVAGAYAIPYVVVFGVPMGAVGYVVRRRRDAGRSSRLRQWVRRRRGSSAEEESDDGDAEAREPPADDDR